MVRETWGARLNTHVFTSQALDKFRSLWDPKHLFTCCPPWTWAILRRMSRPLMMLLIPRSQEPYVT